MEITEVKVFPVSEEKLKAFVSIVLDCCFMVNDIKVIRGKDGLFISMPSRKKKNGEFKDVAHPLNNETRRKIEVHVLEEYERVLRERGEAPEAGRRLLKIDDERGPARPAAAAAAAQEPKEEDSTEGKSLEEVQERHLRDSFWSVS
jgi:stage V sporulation protein G